MKDKELLRMYNIDDVFIMLYLFMADPIIKEFKIDGEAAIREGLRKYGKDRGATNREKHLELGLKLNMKNYFTYTRDLPADPRFKRDRLTLTPQERISHTLKCPVADVSNKYNLKSIGRIYCEEFHDAGYGEYTYGHTQVNLAKTLTQEGDNYCSFSVLLRPENLPDDLKKVCFEEYDPEYSFPEFEDTKPEAKSGYNSLGIRLFYYLYNEIVNQIGEDKLDILNIGFEKLVDETAKLLKESAVEQKESLNYEFVELNQPFNLNTNNEIMWNKYKENGCKSYFQEQYCDKLIKVLDI